MKSIKINYFAVLRERSGRPFENRETAAGTYAELYNELKEAYSFPLDAGRVRLAIGENYSDMYQEIQDDVEIAFIPPVAGG